MDRNFQKGHLYISHSWEYSHKRTNTHPLSVLITKHCILSSTNKKNRDIIVEHCQQMPWLHQCTREQCTGPSFQPLLFYPRLHFSYFENKVLFSHMIENTLHMFLLNKNIYWENINSTIIQSHQILIVHQVRQQNKSM